MLLPSNQTLKLMLFAVISCLVSAAPSYAVPVSWVDWTSANSTSAVGTADGVTVNFTGALNPAAQTSGGINYWAVSPSTYTSAPAVDNAPPSSDIIRLIGGTATGVQTLTFSAPVLNPVMAILSMGQTGIPVQYVFDSPFDILNVGPGYWGNGTLAELPGNVLEGREGHGIIQFTGTFTSISWTIPTAENWHGFTIGVPGTSGPTPVPEPSTLVLSGLAFIGLASRMRRLNRTDA